MKNIIYITIMFLACTASSALAALNIDVNPLEGGNSLRFGQVRLDDDLNKEVRIRITSTDNAQYQIFQRLVDVPINERGQSLNSDAFKSYTVNGSNGSGSLYLQNPESMGFGDQLLYSSSASGASDTLTVVYNMSGDRINGSGSFYGRIQYVIRSVSSSGYDDAYLNVTLDVASQTRVDIAGRNRRDALQLNFSSKDTQSDQLVFSIEDNPGAQINIYQEVEIYPLDTTQEELDRNALVFSTSGSTEGRLEKFIDEPLNRRRTPIYSSTQRSDNFVINVALAKSNEDLKAGKYQGRLRYIVEVDGVPQIFPIDLFVTVNPIFHLDVTLPAGEFRFDKLLPSSPPQLREMQVSVKSNLGRPYMVFQNMISPLTNESGNAIAESFFTIKQEFLSEGKGRLAHPEFANVEEGQLPVYFSDRDGSSAEFKVYYRLSAYSDMAAGSYSTSIRYSLGEM